MLDHDDTLRCARCTRVRTADELDRILWCEDCQAAERRRAGWIGRVVALVVAVALSLWIAVRVQPSQEFLVIWALVVLVAFYLLSRLGQELGYGLARIRNVPGAREGDHEGGAEDGDDEPPARDREPWSLTRR
jgi:hypothetical protein